jgi:glycyl-tRNA synthetase beta chain
VSLADKLDTVVGLFNAGERPTGSRDPFGLRRAAHGILRILLDAEALTGVRAHPRLVDLIGKAQEGYGQTSVDAEPLMPLLLFFAERLEYILEARGFDRRNVRAVIAQYKAEAETSQPVVNVLENLKALPEFTSSEQFRLLATAFKRVRNIARDAPSEVSGEMGAGFDSALKEPAELALVKEIAERAPRIEAAVKLGQGYREAYREAAQFEPAIAKFFTEVFVMVDDPALRNARLRLMKRLERLILQLGDISEIVASES